MSGVGRASQRWPRPRTLLPVATDSNVYTRMIDSAGRGGLHRYYTIEGGNHVDGLYDTCPDRLRPILPCYRAATP